MVCHQSIRETEVESPSDQEFICKEKMGATEPQGTPQETRLEQALVKLCRAGKCTKKPHRQLKVRKLAGQANTLAGLVITEGEHFRQTGDL